MGTTSPTRIDDEVFASAKIVGLVAGRSASQQVSHWARIGRELEASGSVSHRDITEVLAGCRSYDELTAKEQAVVRAEWAERMEERRQSVDLTQRFDHQGRSYVELDDDGRIVSREPAGRGTGKA